jgi:hypothetical protein
VYTPLGERQVSFIYVTITLILCHGSERMAYVLYVFINSIMSIWEAPMVAIAVALVLDHRAALLPNVQAQRVGPRILY